jgi:hypothetical protein
MHDSIEAKRSHIIHCIIADIAYNAMILGMAWFQEQNHYIKWGTGVRHQCTSTNAED